MLKANMLTWILSGDLLNSYVKLTGYSGPNRDCEKVVGLEKAHTLFNMSRNSYSEYIRTDFLLVTLVFLGRV